MEQCLFAAGQYIFGEGDPSDVAYIIDAGSVEIVKATSSGEVRLAVLREGDIFGEMGLIDEAPRSAAARAAEPVTATAVDRDEFVQLILSRSEQGLALLRALFERLRTTNQLLLQEREARGASGEPPSARRRVTLAPATPQASRSVPTKGIELNRFPLRIGRKSRAAGAGVLAFNEVELEDRPPYQVSLNHLAIDLDGNAVVVRDRGSSRGAGVNGTRIGGDALWIAAPLAEGANEVVVGGPDSPFRFTVTVATG